MNTFLKSIFNLNDKNKVQKENVTEKEDQKPETALTLDRRKLSMSRSGRLKHSCKRRHSLSTDIFGENYKTQDRDISKEYNVYPEAYREQTHEKLNSIITETTTDRKLSIDSTLEQIDKAFKLVQE